MRTRHNKRLLGGLLLLMVCSAAMAQYAIPNSVVSGGASDMSNSNYQIVGTVGQPIIGVTSGSSYIDPEGFWYIVGIASPTSAGDIPIALPKTFALEQNYPNPFNPTTQIRFVVPTASRVTIKVFNIEGQLVETLADHNFTVGEHSISWNADRHSSGLYLIQMSAPGFTDIRKAVLLK